MGETVFQQGFAQVEPGIFSRRTCLSYRWRPTPVSGPHTCFRPAHLLPAPHLLLAPASTSGQGRGASGREASVLPRRTPWCTPHPLDLLTPRVLGPGTIDPEPQRVLLGTWCIGGCSQETGQESELESGLQQISGEDLWSTRGGVPLGKGAILSSLCQSEPGWDLGPGTRWCRACNWTDIASTTGSLASQRHPGKFPKVPGRRRGTRGFPAAPRQRPRSCLENPMDGGAW